MLRGLDQLPWGAVVAAYCGAVLVSPVVGFMPLIGVVVATAGSACILEKVTDPKACYEQTRRKRPRRRGRRRS